MLFWEDQIESGEPTARTRRTASGVEFYEFGDPEIDALERQWAEQVEADEREAARLRSDGEALARRADASPAGEIDVLGG